MLVEDLGILSRRKKISKTNFVKTIVDEFQDYDLDIIFEPGRSIVGDCGLLVSEVQYIKNHYQKT